MPKRASLLVALGIGLVARSSWGQAAPSDAIVVAGFTLRPLLEVRLRGEYRRHPIDTGGDVFSSSAVLANAPASGLPQLVSLAPEVGNQYLLAERSRLGLAVDRGPITAAFTLQDARVFGSTDAAFQGAGEAALPSLAPIDAYVDLHAKHPRDLFLRIGRQRVTWGEGKLVGEDDWSPTARALDAIRGGFELGDFDVEGLAALLAAPGGLPPAVTGTHEAAPESMGSELYGVDGIWHFVPLLRVEATGLARIVRDPSPAALTPSDVYVIDGRLSGDRRGFRYTAEGAYETGRVAAIGELQHLSAFAFAGHASLETSLFWRLTFGVEAAYASGDNGKGTGTLKRFDPILPNEHDAMGPMGMFAWSNIEELGGSIAMTPLDPVGVLLGYHHVDLADAKGRWTTASLVPVGASDANVSKKLGDELDAAFKLTPLQPLEIQAGYGFFVNGDGARQILLEVGRQAKLEHWVYLQMQVRLP